MHCLFIHRKLLWGLEMKTWCWEPMRHRHSPAGTHPPSHSRPPPPAKNIPGLDSVQLQTRREGASSIRPRPSQPPPPACPAPYRSTLSTRHALQRPNILFSRPHSSPPSVCQARPRPPTIRPLRPQGSHQDAFPSLHLLNRCTD